MKKINLDIERPKFYKKLPHVLSIDEVDKLPTEVNEEDIKVIIYGFQSLPDDLREYCKTMLEIFDDVHEETPNVVFELIS